MTPQVLLVVGARPNFVKMAPLSRALAGRADISVRLLHTGQHYDPALSDNFILQLGLPAPDHHLGVGSGTHGTQTAAVIVGAERVLLADPPAAIVVAGDVNSTLGASLAAVKLGIPIVHLEAGLRSRDWTMPEEVNRVLVDRMAQVHLCHCEEAVENLRLEGISGDGVAFVGNTMIDSLQRLRDAAEATRTVERLGLRPHGYVLVTLHRPALVDAAGPLRAVVEVLAGIAREIPVVFPVHPRTRARLSELDPERPGALTLLDPLGYLDFVCLEASARVVVTDSGGIQEETSSLGIPCLTYRSSTERAVTVRLGTNRVIGMDPERLRAALREEIHRGSRQAVPPLPLWDGYAGERAAEVIQRFVSRSE